LLCLDDVQGVKISDSEALSGYIDQAGVVEKGTSGYLKRWCALASFAPILAQVSMPCSVMGADLQRLGITSGLSQAPA
jgi:hypothetical protein